MLRVRFILLPIIVISLMAEVQAQSWKQYPYTPEGSLISFPVDEGRHAEEMVEWWYISGQLTGSETGIPYSFMLSYFYYPAYGYDGFRILNLCRDDSGEFISDVQGLHYNTLEENRLNIHASMMYDSTEWWINRVDSSDNIIPFEYVSSASGEKAGIHLSVETMKNPLIHGDSGYFNQGANSYTYYYSFTDNTVSGTIRFGDISEEVQGTAWIDKQYGDLLSEPDEKYEWLNAKLSNGMDIVLWDLFNGYNQLPNSSTYKQMNVWVDSLTQYSTHDYQLERLSYAYVPDNEICYARQWRLTSQTNQIDLIISTINSHDDVVLPFRFYEGATMISGTVNGKSVTGTGFAELLKSYLPPEPALLYPPVGGGTWKDSLRIGWALLNPDDGRNTLYDLEYTTDGGTSYTLLQEGVRGTTYHWKETDPLEYGDSCLFRITAYTPDRILTGSVSSQHAFVYLPDTTVVTGSDPLDSDSDIELYPVPARNKLMIHMGNPGLFRYYIYDSKGIMVRADETSGESSLTEISVESLEPGVYMMIIKSSEEAISRHQFIKL